MEDVKLPKIEDLKKITPEQAAEYIRFVATMRHNQRRYFATRNPQVLDLSKRMEKDLDALNDQLLNPTLKLF
jgi:hypothetical protein